MIVNMEFISRSVYFQLLDHLKQPEISVLLGPRQAGKTTLIKKMRQELINQNQPTVFLNLDVIEDRRLFISQHTLLDFIEKKAGKQKTYVFIDEVSRLEDAGLFLKGLYDLNSEHKFIVTGSGSLELKTKIVEPLTGRKKNFYCLPLSFTEFAAYKLDMTNRLVRPSYSEVTKALISQPLNLAERQAKASSPPYLIGINPPMSVKHFLLKNCVAPRTLFSTIGTNLFLSLSISINLPLAIPSFLFILNF